MSLNEPTNDPARPTSKLDTTETRSFSSSEQLSNLAEMGEIKDNHVSHKRGVKPFIVLAAVIAALGGLVFGYDIAGAGATFVMTGFKEHFGWSCVPGDEGCVADSQESIDRQQGAINGLFGAGATIGAILNPYIADRWGRKKCLFLASTVFTIGATLQTISPVMEVMYVGRIIAGSGIGALSMGSPVYIAECAPEEFRGSLGTLWQLAITVGIVIASAANLGLKNWDEGWRLSYGGNILVSILLIVCLYFMPESPRWLAANGTEEELNSALEKLRYDDEVDAEKECLEKEVKESKENGTASWGDLLSTDNSMRYRLFLGVGFFAAQQLSGINAIMFYAPKILDYFFGADGAIYGTFGLNVVNCLATFITVFSIDKVGRVKLLVSGGIIMTISLVANAILSSVERSDTVGWFVIIFCGLYIVGFAYSWGPVPWVVCSEMFPLRARGKSNGATSMTHWLFTTVIGALFPRAATASLSGCFGFFSFIIFIGIVMIYLYEPETKGLDIFQIDQKFANHKVKVVRKDW